MKYLIMRLKRFCGFLTGFVFFISGILKLMDPTGAGLVMEEYFRFLHITFMAPVAKVMGFLLALVETTVGTALVTGVWRRATAVAALSLQGFFTVLTLILVIFNPEMDCGCFGEAIHLTHIQTFIKNLVLCALLAGYTVPLRALGGPKKRKYASFAIVTVSTVAFGIWSWISIPLKDFTEFKPAAMLQAGSGTTLPDETQAPMFVYEKDGREASFSIEELPDSTWIFVRTEAAEPDYLQHSVSLSFYDSEGIYHDEEAAKGKVMIVSIHNTQKISAKRQEKISVFIREAEAAGFSVMVLTAGDAGHGFRADGAEVYHADRKTLMTMNRSNGGVTYFSEGYLIRKWPVRSLPDAEDLKEIMAGDDTEVIIGHNTNGDLTLQGFLLYVFAVMLLL